MDVIIKYWPKILGGLIASLAVSCFFFNWPIGRDTTADSTAFAVGMGLLVPNEDKVKAMVSAVMDRIINMIKVK